MNSLAFCWGLWRKLLNIIAINRWALIVEYTAVNSHFFLSSKGFFGFAKLGGEGVGNMEGLQSSVLEQSRLIVATMTRYDDHDDSR